MSSSVIKVCPAQKKALEVLGICSHCDAPAGGEKAQILRRDVGLLQGPLPLIYVGSSSTGAWEAEAALGGAKLFLIGSPYASDFCFSNIVEGPLQARPFCSYEYQWLLQTLKFML